MKIGFIGLGHMGAAMAANLVRAGHKSPSSIAAPAEPSLVELAPARQPASGRLQQRGGDHDARG